MQHQSCHQQHCRTRPQAKPRKGEEGYDPDAPHDGSDANSAVALVPTAPPLHCDLEAVLAGAGDVLSLEPPVWVPDSHCGDCTSCRQPFRSAASSCVCRCVWLVMLAFERTCC